MKNLVTGGCGFIGSNLIDRLIKNGEFVVCLDDLTSGRSENIKKFVNNNKFRFIQHDVINPLKLNIRIEKIWHLACPASPIHYQIDPIRTSKINFQGTLNILEFAKENNSKLLLASSSEVYGNPKIHPQNEEYLGSVNPIGIRSCYDEGKRIAESLCFDFSRMYDLEIKVARIFNTYGPNMSLNDGRVISNFISQGLQKKPLTIFGKGDQSRSFCFIEDLIEGLIKFMNSNYKGPINLGNPEEITIKNLAYLISGKVGNEFLYKEMSLPIDDPQKRRPSIEKAIKFIDWEPNYSLSKGLDLTIDYFKKVLN